jgi:hypothetical protein
MRQQLKDRCVYRFWSNASFANGIVLKVNVQKGFPASAETSLSPTIPACMAAETTAENTEKYNSKRNRKKSKKHYST